VGDVPRVFRTLHNLSTPRLESLITKSRSPNWHKTVFSSVIFEGQISSLGARRVLLPFSGYISISVCDIFFVCLYFFLVNFFKLSKMSKSFVTEIQGLKTRYRRALNYIFSSANSLSNKLLEKKCFSPMDLSKTKNMYFEFFSAVFLWWCRVVKWA
jgi:hypothetical protein